MLSPTLTSPFFFVFLPFLAAGLLPTIYRTAKKHVGWFALTIPLWITLLLATYLPADSPAYFTYSWIARLGINISFMVDGLSLFFGILISFIGLLVIFYSIFYLSKKEDLLKFYIYLLLFMGSMLGVVFSDNLILLFIFWECTSISSFLLIGYWWQNDRSRYGAIKALLITGLGGLAMFGGFLLLGISAGTFELHELFGVGIPVQHTALYPWILTLIFIGCAAKSAQFPFHIWLPNAMEAPTPISAYLHSATMVKAGIFLVARLWPILGGTTLWTTMITSVGLMTMFVGGMLAIKARDLKGLLAYSTISQLGMIMSMLGFGTTGGAEAAVVHIYNHAAFKAALFMMVGVIDHETGTRDIEKLGGLKKAMPKSAALALLGCLSMAGLPPLGGFISKELFYESALGAPGAVWISALAVAAGMFTFAYSAKFFVWSFLGAPRGKTPKHAHEAPNTFLGAPGLLIGIAVLLGFFPQLFEEKFFVPAISAVTQRHAHIHLKLWHGFSPPLWMSAITIAGGMLLISIVRKINALQDRWARALPIFTVNFYYDLLLEKIAGVSSRMYLVLQNGKLRTYLAVIFGFIVATSFYFSGQNGWKAGRITVRDACLFSAEGFAALLIITFALCCAFFKERIRIILALGLAGFSIAFLYQRMGAPDLALTQYLIETVSVLLMLLVFYYVPPLFPEKIAPTAHLMKLLLCGAFGLFAFFFTYDMMNRGHLLPSITEFYNKHSWMLAGGKNIVNVIIVDFRGFDTMWEISVLSLATLGILALLKLKQKKEHA